MVGLAEFLAARLNEDAAVARGAPGDWHVTGVGVITGSPGIALHVARWNPARVLREVDAKRRILAAYSEHADLDIADPEPEYAYGHAGGLGVAVRHLAAAYSDHPDYDPAWKEIGDG
jgi:Family of unknown function (DUF6221)